MEHIKFIPFSLSSYEEFISCSWVKEIILKYELEDQILAFSAYTTLLEHLEFLNKDYEDKFGRRIFTRTDGRVKDIRSILKKMYKRCCEKDEVLTRDSLK